MLKWLPVFSLFVLCGCEMFKSQDTCYSQNQRGDTHEDKERQREGKLFGDSLEIGGGSKAPGIGVNATLWRAALDTVSFMPLSSADPVGGTIMTEWYSPVNEPTERFKVDIIILGRALRPDALRVSLHKQRLNAQGQWRSVEVSEESVRELEDSILTRARELNQNKGGF